MSLNDPQWGRRPGGNNQGPPDLDEIWRNLNQRLNKLLGGKGGGNGESPGGGGPSAGAVGGGAGLLIALVVVVWIASGFYIVNEGQRGVVLRFGKFVETT
ncbi:MAG: protease modulator HflK N-terminal domain-containing protein, partial [Betaproteobacteria bacterium]|nr:protease modulator HflK N-terminal domain-containing protein [Betaproteobacteria bacterium]